MQRFLISITWTLSILGQFQVQASTEIEDLKSKLEEIKDLEKKVQEKINHLETRSSQTATSQQFTFSINSLSFWKLDKELTLSPAFSYERNSSNSAYSIEATYNHYDSKSFTNNITTRSRSFKANTENINKRIFSSLLLVSQASYFREREDHVYLTHSDYSIGPLGLGKDFLVNKNWKFLLVYIPLYEYTSQSAVITGLVDNDGSNVYQKKNERGLRQSMQARVNWHSLNQNYEWMFAVYYQPFYSFDHNNIVWENNKFTLKNKFKSRLNDILYVGVSNEFERNIQRKNLQNLPSTDLKTELRFIFEQSF